MTKIRKNSLSWQHKQINNINKDIVCGTVLRESTVLREKMDAIIEAQEIH